MKKIIVFGGWAVPPDILKCVVGDDGDYGGGDTDYIDINHVMPKLFDGQNQLKTDWPNIIVSACQLTNSNAYNTIVGWSTGAIIAYAAAMIHPPKKLLLLSATPCFCRKDGFQFGTRVSVVDKMINSLYSDKNGVLKSFYERCGLEYDPSLIPPYSLDELTLGLEFLKQTDLRPLAPPPITPEFLHGRDDQIIPPEASIYFSNNTNGRRAEFYGGHAFFQALQKKSKMS